MMPGPFLTEFLSSPAAVGACTFMLGFLTKVVSDRLSANRLFDHRLKLEKEYSLYGDIWERLFELRRDHGARVQSLETGAAAPSIDEVCQRHDAFQAVVRRNEPFMVTSVYDAAREIVRHSGEIISNDRKIHSIDVGHPTSARGRNAAADEQHAVEKIRLDDESDTSFEEIERLYQVVLTAIRARVRVP